MRNLVRIGILATAFVFPVVSNIALAFDCGKIWKIVDGTLPEYTFKTATPATFAELVPRQRQLVKEVDAQVKKAAEKFGVSGAQHIHVSDQASWVAGELFRNATMWGNKYDAQKSIELNFHATKDGVLVSMKDQGTTPFDPLSDPGRRRNDESPQQFERRREALGKITKVGVTEGLFWQDINNYDLRHAYRFSDGSQVVIFIPWTFSRYHQMH